MDQIDQPHRPPLDIDQAAAYIGVNVPFMRRRVQLRELPYVKLGRLLRFHAHDLDAYLAANRVEASARSSRRLNTARHSLTRPTLVPRQGAVGERPSRAAQGHGG